MKAPTTARAPPMPRQQLIAILVAMAVAAALLHAREHVVPRGVAAAASTGERFDRSNLIG
jgi:hypothetical protein